MLRAMKLSPEAKVMTQATTQPKAMRPPKNAVAAAANLARVGQVSLQAANNPRPRHVG